MLSSPRALFRLFKESIQEWVDDKASRLAAALAYYTVFSLAPILVIAVAVAGAVFGQSAAEGELTARLEATVGPRGATFVETALSNASQPDLSNLASLISVGVLLFGASNACAQLQEALNDIWEADSQGAGGILSFLLKRLFALLMVLGVGLFLILSMLASTAIAALRSFDIFEQLALEVPGTGLQVALQLPWQGISLAISFAIVTLLFATIYKFVPDTYIAWRDVWTGALVTAVLFAVGRAGLAFYLERGGFSSTYGAAGSLVAFLFWIYYSAQIFLFGAEFTEVYSRRHGSRRPSAIAAREEAAEP